MNGLKTLLEITGDDIALLSDADLRSLIGLLCEADFRLAGLPTKGIIWGGHQDASDDGLDVTVLSDAEPPKNSMVPRKITGFQAKKPVMQPRKIMEEMKPKGKLRSEIKKLMSEGGAYIIVNSSGTTTNKALNLRAEAMRKAVADEPNYEQLYLDFYDRDRIATWVRTYSSLILWVRNKIGRPLQGWRPYDNWANMPAGIQEEYIVDEKTRLFDGTNSENGESIIDGLNKLRLRLSQNGASIRLTGLSGVGKTRFVQALFDERIGKHALNPSLAHYADVSESPIPAPTTFATQLVGTNAKAILIVDNCSPELHRTLNKLCVGSMVSLLTVEYDIREDIPEETNVFKLEASSDSVIERLLERRYPYVSQINRRTITTFANGNARVAISLANTLKQGESLSTLKDEELFDRLFYQRHNPNESLKFSAEICSLAYSFDVGDEKSTTSELDCLAKLAEKSSRELYRDIKNLKDRGLVQARSVWRAVLPHAIANRLAKSALNSIPSQTIVKAFLSSDSERLITSFTRRLSYLNDCEAAIEIAKQWLMPNGWLGATNCDFNSFGLTVFKNIAPLAPEATLAVLERVARESGGLERLQHNEFIQMLRHLAYDSELFQRSIKLLLQLALLEKPDIIRSGFARETLSTLYHIVLSGTHAPAQTRASIIEQLINSNLQEEQDLGIDLLESAMQTPHFTGTPIDTFGARPRDFGYHPKTNQEFIGWYKTFLAICTRTAISCTPIGRKARRTFANQLRGLWSIGVDLGQEFLEDLERSVINIHNRESWNEGWISVKEIIRYDGKQMNQKALSRLKQLLQHLKPVNLLEQARAYALTEGHFNFDLDDDYDNEKSAADPWNSIQEKTRQIGASVARDEVVFRELLPELVSTHQNCVFAFGQGLADDCVDRKCTWKMLYGQFKSTSPEKRQITVMLGFLSSCATYDQDLYHSILDSIIKDELLGPWFPNFQVTSKIDKRGIERLHKALDEGNAHISSFKQLAWGRSHETIGDNDLAVLLQKILTKEEGVMVAIEILSMRFHTVKEQSVDRSHALVGVSRNALLNYNYEEKQTRNNSVDYELAQIAAISFSGEEGAQSTKELCQRIALGFEEYQINSFDFPLLLGMLAKVQPDIFLDTFIGRDRYMFRNITFDDFERSRSPVNKIPEDVILNWCKQDPATRYPLIVSSMQMYSKPKDSEELYWHPILSTIFAESYNLPAVLSQIEKEIYPMSWSGSRADVLAKRLPLFTKLLTHPNLEIRDWAVKQYQKLQHAIEENRQREMKENQKRFERFE